MRNADGALKSAMPLYEYQCQECDKPFEAFVTADRKASCPACGGEKLVKQYSRLGMVGAGDARADACVAPAPMCGARGGHCGCVN
jgi:putative FmdB family regulatory protein